MTSTFAVVSTPFQYLNAQEAIHHFKPEHVRIVSAFRRHQASALDEIPIAEAVSQTDHIQRPNFPGPEKFRKTFQDIVERPLASKLSKMAAKYDRLIIGNVFDPLQLHLAAQRDWENLILVDDGAAIYKAVKWLTGTESGASITERQRRILGYRQNILTQITFFSAFLTHEDTENLVPNRYALNKARHPAVVDAIVSPTVWFIGQPIVEVGVIKLDDFLSIMKRIQEYYSCKNFVYIAHPTEKIDSAKIQAMEKMSIKIQKFKKPIELELVGLRNLPAIFASFYSSSMLTINAMMKEKCKFEVFSIGEENILTPQYNDNITKVIKKYEFISGSSIKLVDHF